MAVLSPFRHRASEPRRLRRGVFLLPSIFTMANLFCGYACIIYTMRGEYVTAAPFIGIALLLDTLDGRIARMTGATSAFGVEFDSLADIVSFGLAPAILVWPWGLAPLGRVGWAVGFLYVAAAATRLARFNIQGPAVDKRFFVGMPSPAAASVLAATVFAHPAPLQTSQEALPALLLVLTPAFLMVTTIRFRSFKQVDLGQRRSSFSLILVAAALSAIAANPPLVLAALSYAYLASGPTAAMWARLRRRSAAGTDDAAGRSGESPRQTGTRPSP